MNSSRGNGSRYDPIAFASIVLAACLLSAGPAAGQVSQGPRLQLDHLSRLSSQSGEVVDVAVDEAMLKQASGLLSASSADPAIKAIVSGLKAVYVKSFQFDRDGAYTPADVDLVRSQLKTPWSRIVNIQSQREREQVEVYVWREGDQPGGLAVLVVEPRELTVVNLIGRIDLSLLAALQGHFGVPRELGLDKPAGQKPQ
jgi:hypothetical protein